MLMSAKARAARSKQRKALNEELNVWLQREKDAEVWPNISAQERSEKILFCRQEQARLRKTLRGLDRGFARQRAWSQGKLNY